MGDPIWKWTPDLQLISKMFTIWTVASEIVLIILSRKHFQIHMQTEQQDAVAKVNLIVPINRLFIILSSDLSELWFACE